MSEERLVALIRTHLARYPQMQIADIYKLLHQAAFGPGHLIASKKAAREWLEHEAGRVSPSAEGPLLESVHPDEQIVRLYLRPYLATGGNLKSLLEAFVRSAEQVRGDAQQLAAWWRVFEGLCAEGLLCADVYQQREAALFGRARKQEGWPAVHHSPAYHALYQPAYRVLTATEAGALCRKLGVPLAVV
ncbi:MAG: hypothetical protein KJ047_14920 [Anaerolineae bacterium]|nr:hypothetical protein [Anaerolineae bacterium]